MTEPPNAAYADLLAAVTAGRRARDVVDEHHQAGTLPEPRLSDLAALLDRLAAAERVCVHYAGTVARRDDDRDLALNQVWSAWHTAHGQHITAPTREEVRQLVDAYHAEQARRALDRIPPYVPPTSEAAHA